MTRPVRAVRLGPRDLIFERGPDGVVLLKSPHPLPCYPAKITERLDHWAQHAPDRVALGQRDADGCWQTVSYAELRERGRCVAQGLLDRQLSPERPVVVLSGNDIEHALIQFGALYAGIPYAPVSPAYSLMSSDFAKLKDIFRLLTPGLVYASLKGAFGAAIAAARPSGVEVIFKDCFQNLAGKTASAAVDAAHSRVGPDTIAKFLFTSGSTGTPKAVINTQRMWCSNQAMTRFELAYLQDEPPVMVEWAPWHHTAGGNKSLGMSIFNGGSTYIDEGKPLPGAIELTVRNLREIAPTYYFNVPKGYEVLLPYLRNDAALRRTFFSRLKVLWFASAGVAQHVFDEMKSLAYQECGEEVLFLTGLGSTETAPFTLGRTWATENAGNMGLPPPGVEVKLVPFHDNYEMRLKGPHITPGYWREPELTARAFDDEGFYRLGDAFSFADPADPGKGLIFEGRISEDFKLATGTWVHVGPLRASFIAHFAPLVRDVVIAGEGRSELGALVFVNTSAPREKFEALLSSFALSATGSSNRIARAALLEEPPSLDAGEITDKGSINQRAVLARRKQLVDDLYRVPATGRVLLL